jgi:uroporphyrinogen-III synthase
VYERRLASASQQTLDELREACGEQTVAVITTSTEVLDGLLALVPESSGPRLRDAVLVVPGERVAAAARERGWRGRVVVAASAEDEAMMDALVGALGGGGRTNRA